MRLCVFVLFSSLLQKGNAHLINEDGFVASIISYKSCIIHAFFYFIRSKIILDRNLFSEVVMNLTTRVHCILVLFMFPKGSFC